MADHDRSAGPGDGAATGPADAPPAAEAELRPALLRAPGPKGPAVLLRCAGRVWDVGEHARAHDPGPVDDPVWLAGRPWMAPEPLAELVARGRLREVAPPEQVLLPVDRGRVGKILALGKNFRAHAAEFGEDVPAEPLFFNKLPETLVPHGATVAVPDWYDGRVDHEAELALVIGRPGARIEPERALEHVAGYTVANDLTARTLQGRDRGLKHPWFRAKNLDGFAPLGPCLVPRDHLDVGAVTVEAEVNGALRQRASTTDWIVDVPRALAWLSRHLTLHAGDVVLMGTPAGVGPLEHGDTVTCRASGVGALTTRIERPGR